MPPFRCPFCYSLEIIDYINRVAYCKSCKKEFSFTDELFDIIHRLWGKATKNEDYGDEDKLLWSRLNEILHSIVHMIYKK